VVCREAFCLATGWMLGERKGLPHLATTELFRCQRYFNPQTKSGLMV